MSASRRARLAIVDLPGGQQPFSDPSGRYQLVFNGEIYNAAELRAELARDGWPLSTLYAKAKTNNLIGPRLKEIRHALED